MPILGFDLTKKVSVTIQEQDLYDSIILMC